MITAKKNMISQFDKERALCSMVYDHMRANNLIPVSMFEPNFKPYYTDTISPSLINAIDYPELHFAHSFHDLWQNRDNLFSYNDVCTRHIEFLNCFEHFAITQAMYDLSLRRAVQTLLFPVFNLETGTFASGYSWATEISLDEFYQRRS